MLFACLYILFFGFLPSQNVLRWKTGILWWVHQIKKEKAPFPQFESTPGRNKQGEMLRLRLLTVCWSRGPDLQLPGVKAHHAYFPSQLKQIACSNLRSPCFPKTYLGQCCSSNLNYLNYSKKKNHFMGNRL